MTEQQGTTKRYFLSNLTFWRWCVALPATIILIGIALSLPFGNSQWSKWHYMFQWNVWPKKKPQIPKEYNGKWKSWDEEGILREDCNFQSGVPEQGFLLAREINLHLDIIMDFTEKAEDEIFKKFEINEDHISLVHVYEGANNHRRSNPCG